MNDQAPADDDAVAGAPQREMGCGRCGLVFVEIELAQVQWHPNYSGCPRCRYTKCTVMPSSRGPRGRP